MLAASTPQHRIIGNVEKSGPLGCKLREGLFTPITPRTPAKPSAIMLPGGWQMKSLIIAVMFCMSVGLASGQQLSPAFHGIWALNVEKSDFGRTPKPRAGLVNWGEHGWVFSIATADGRVYADGVVTDNGCALLGAFPSKFSCKVQIVSPRHVRFTLLDDDAVRRVGDIELLSDNTTQTTHRITPSKGAPYIEKTIWEKQK
jgi:hypothetical protein